MKLRRTALALLPLSLLVTVGATGPAQAQTRTTHDARHDVVGGADSEMNPTHVVPRRAEGDVLSVRVTHGAGAVRVLLHYAQLSRERRAMVVHFVTLRTDEGLRAGVDLIVDRGDRHGQGDPQWSATGDSQESSCPGLRTRIDYRSDTVRMVVPRNCLSDPRWVRVGAGGGSFVGGRLYADDAALRGRVADDVVLGPRVRRS